MSQPRSSQNNMFSLLEKATDIVYNRAEDIILIGKLLDQAYCEGILACRRGTEITANDLVKRKSRELLERKHINKPEKVH